MRLGVLGGRAHVLDGRGQGADVHAASAGLLPSDPMALLEKHWADLREWSEELPADAYDVLVEYPALQLPVPRPRQVFAVALNYLPHAAEAGFMPPPDPLFFTKFPTCLAGPYTTVELPEGNVDWEAELVAVIGAETRHVPAGRAWEHVAALAVGQDLSERVTQSRGAPAQFSLGKSFPGFGPIGPVLVTPDEFDDPDDLEVTTLLGDEVVQHDRTKSMIFPVPELVARLSAILPLLPGDLIFTGTPAGVGNRRTPPRYLTPDDLLVTRISGIGEIRQCFTRS